MGQEVIVRCHCGQLTEKVQLRDEIPVKGSLCHCNSCRHVTGTLTFSGVTLVSPPAEAFTSKLVRYPTSEKIHRYFCKTCGSHVCYYVVKEDRWSACSGAVDEVIGGSQGTLEKYTDHEFVGDTVDGGLAWTLPDIPVYVAGLEGTPLTDLRSETRRWQESANTTKEDKLEAQCHCGQVRLSVLRPDDSTSKWEGGLCVCRSCRLSFSQPLVAWALNVPSAKVVWGDGTAYDGSAHPSITRFQSSDHAHRDFCSKCGASVFYSSTTQPGLMDVAFGLLRAKDGALAKSFFEWDTGKIHHQEDALDKELVKHVKDNLGALKQT